MKTDIAQELFSYSRRFWTFNWELFAALLNYTTSETDTTLFCLNNTLAMNLNETHQSVYI